METINTLIWGFEGVVGNAIVKLAEENIVNPKFWMSWISETENADERNIKFANILYKANDFYFKSNWFDIYKNKVIEYEKDIPFNAEVYENVYRHLYHYCDCESRHEVKGDRPDFHYYLNEFNLLYKFLYAVMIKENIQLCLFSDGPHTGGDIMVYHIAKSLGIRTIIIEQSSIPDNYYGVYYMEDMEDRGDFSCMKEIYHNSQKEIVRKSAKDYFYMQTTIKSTLKQKIRKIKKLLPFRKKYKNYREYLKNINSMIEPVDYGKKYVYFPLHLQPEKTTSTDGGIYCDQVLAIEKLSSIIPSDWMIYIKENPKQTEFMRDELFFRRLKLLPNVKIVPLEESSLKLIQNSQVVSIISGTAGWEALCEGKPVILFGRGFYKNFEGCFSWNENLDFAKIANYKIDMNKLTKDYNNLLSRMPRTIILPGYIKAIPDYNDEESCNNMKNLLIKLINNK